MLHFLIEPANKKYDAGEIPIHFLLNELNVPLVRIYQDIPSQNIRMNSMHLSPTIFVRHGGRSLQEKPLKNNKCVLYLDITALLLASHINILDTVEKSFAPLRISPSLLAALQNQITLLAPQQPSQQKVYAEILLLIKEEKIHIVPSTSRRVVKAKSLAKRMGLEWTAIVEKMLSQDGCLVEFFPLKRQDNDLREVRLHKPYKDAVINCRTLVKSLRKAANLSEGSYTTILKDLGEFGAQNPRGSLPELGTKVYLSRGVAHVLGNAKILSLICEYFQVYLGEDCVRDVEHEIDKFERNKATVSWTQALSDRIREGLENRVYETINKLEVQAEAGSESDIDVNTKILTDLFYFKTKKGDVIWIDDRFCNSNVHRDGAPIIGVNEILRTLLEKKVISEEIYYKKLLQLRKENFRYLPISSNEINYHLKQAQIVNDVVVETEELSIIRKYIASCFLDSERLQSAPLPKGAANVNGETAFIVGVLRAVQTAIVDQWKKEGVDSRVVEARADWVYGNLYVGMFGVRHLREKDTFGNDGIDLLGLDIGMAYMDGISLSRVFQYEKTGQDSPQKLYFNWLGSRISESRFKANPSAMVAVTHVIENHLMGVIDKSKEDAEKESSYRIILQVLFLNLPELIRNQINLPPDKMEWLGIKTFNSLHIGNIHFRVDDFWPAVESALSGEKVIIKALEPKMEYFIERRNAEEKVLDIKDGKGLVLISYKDEIMFLLSDDFDKRKKVLDLNLSWFDYNEGIYKKALTEILLIEDPHKRVEEVYKLRQASGTLFYERLKESIVGKNKFRCKPPLFSASLK